jgi:multimeric flavodoxin WrbA
MKITAFNGSPRGETGNTHIMVESFLKGAKDAGADVENVLLAGKSIRGCTGCFGCWVKTPGKCVIKDDMEKLLEKALSSDVVVFATPLYVDNVTGLMKNFMDRMIPMIEPYFAKDEHGESRHVLRNKNIPKLIAMSNCGFPEQSHFQVLSLLFSRMARNMHSELIAEIYRGEGEFLRLNDHRMKPIIDKYKETLERAGGEIAKDLKLSEATAGELEKPLIPYDIYLRHATRHWDAFLRKK